MRRPSRIKKIPFGACGTKQRRDAIITDEVRSRREDRSGRSLLDGEKEKMDCQNKNLFSDIKKRGHK